MSWEEFVRENEGPELDAARRRFRDGDDCPGCGAPAGMPPAGPCDNHGTAAATALTEERDDRYREALERIASHPLVAKSSDPAVQVDQMRLYASEALAPAEERER